jgi:hypothetical protein
LFRRFIEVWVIFSLGNFFSVIINVNLVESCYLVSPESARCVIEVRTFFRAENVLPTDAQAAGIINNKADNILTSGNDVPRFEAIKYLRSEILFQINSFEGRITVSSV